MITKIKWKDDAVLGNLELNFINPKSGEPYNTIVLAGENGSGKTTILASIADFLNKNHILSIDYIEYTTSQGAFRISLYNSTGNARLGTGYITSLTDNTTTPVYTTNIDTNPKDLRYYGVAYSKARSGFPTKRVDNVTSLLLDSSKYEIDKNDDYTHIKQLIIDIDSQDSSDFISSHREGNCISIENFEKQSRMKRFRTAFNNFFDNLKFDRINTVDSQGKVILFKKHGKTILSDNLSTGESQIVYRGASLLSNSEKLIDSTILIDEPELSMHPHWQQKILQFYRDLFTKNHKQTSQLIVATHSEYVVKAALEDSDNVLVIVLKDDNGTIMANEVKTPLLLPTITAAEVNFVAFGICSTDYHIQLYSHFQNKTKTQSSVAGCDTEIYNHPKFNTNYGYISKHRHTTYKTLPTYIRNCIDHPDSNNKYTPKQLQTSIEFLREICK